MHLPVSCAEKHGRAPALAARRVRSAFPRGQALHGNGGIARVPRTAPHIFRFGGEGGDLDGAFYTLRFASSVLPGVSGGEEARVTGGEPRPVA
jgi:hypothetical protein